MFSPWKMLCAAACLVVSGSAGAQDKQVPVLLAYARETRLEMLVGQYDPAVRKWLDNTKPFIPSDVDAPFSLFGPRGKITQVHIHEPFRTRDKIVPWEWAVTISSWSGADPRVALALSGEWPDLARPARVLPLNHPDAEAAVSDFFARRRLQVPHPRITQALRVDLNGDGQEQTLVCANSDLAALTTAAEAVYSVALLRTTRNGKPVLLPLRAVAVFKPAGRSLDEHERFHGRLGFLQVLALVDVDQDGQDEIVVLNDNRKDGPEIDLYALNGDKVTHLLEGRPIYF